MHEMICARCERRENCPGTRNQTCLRVAESLAVELAGKLDAALTDLRAQHMEGRCGCCKYYDSPKGCADVDFVCANCPHPCKCGYCDGGSNWEWRGVKDENV